MGGLRTAVQINTRKAQQPGADQVLIKRRAGIHHALRLC